MSGSKINNYSTLDNNIEEVELTLDKCFNDRLTLTEMLTTTVPKIAAGSRVEVGGAFFKFDSDEAISTTDPVTGTTVADGIVYVMLKPAVDGLTITAVMTATAPTWSDSKQGWYGTSTYAGYKYIKYVITKATASYVKYKINPINGKRFVPYIKLSFTDITDTNKSLKSGTFSIIPIYDYNGEAAAASITLKTSGIYRISYSLYSSITNVSSAGYLETVANVLSNSSTISGSIYEDKYVGLAGAMASHVISSEIYNLSKDDVIEFSASVSVSAGTFATALLRGHAYIEQIS
jgi:hypothetical protein